MTLSPCFRIGVDLGGTKIAARVLLPGGAFGPEHRVATPRGDYAETVRVVRDLAHASAAAVGADWSHCHIGIGIPGSEAPTSGLVQNANSTWLNDRAFGRDLRQATGRPVRLANDANCFALSEAYDGAGAGSESVFGVILGTGCGGAYVVNGALISGPRGNQGEWGHTPLPFPLPQASDPVLGRRADERPGPTCWCGRQGCLETWISGPALAADHECVTGTMATPEEILDAADAGDPLAVATRARHLDRCARGLAVVVNLLDPGVIVIGGGLSARPHFYDALPTSIAPCVFARDQRVDVRPPVWGDASGVRGAARLWPD